MASTVRDMFPFGDIDAGVVDMAAGSFTVPSVGSVLAGFALGRAAIDLLDAMLTLLAGFGLSPARWRLVIALMFQSDERGATIGELAGHLEVREPTVTATVDRLEREGLVRRVREEHDRRRVRVSLTSEGRETAARVIPFIAGRVAEIVDAMGGAADVDEMVARISRGTAIAGAQP